MKTRALRALYELVPGRYVQLPDDPTCWEIVAVSGTTASSLASQKWCWLRRDANTYRQIKGSAQLRMLRLVSETRKG